MKVSKKAYYGLRAILALAQTGKPMSTHALAVLERLPEDYLEKILQSLRRAGLVESQKGADGGYALARPIGDITVWDILSTLDGPIKAFDPPKREANTLPCPEVTHCQSNEVWRILEENIVVTLSRITLEKLLPHSSVTK